MKSALLRNLLVALAVLALLAGGVAAWLIASFDADRTKALAVDWMRQHRDRTLVIGGPLKLSVFPRLAVQMSDVRLSERGKAAEFVALDEASLSVALLPLLSRSVVVDRVSARGVRLNFTRDAKGQGNLDDLVGGGPPGASASGGSALRFDVSSVELKDLRAHLQDELTGVKGEIGIDTLSTGRLADKAETPVSLKANFDLQAPVVRGGLAGETRLMLDLSARSVRLQAMTLTFKGDALGAGAIDATLSGALAWNGSSNTLQADGVALKGGASFGTLKLTGSSLELQRFAFDAAERRLSLDKLTLTVSGTNGGSPLKLALDWPKLEVSGRTLRGDALSGSFSIGGESALAVRFRSAPPQGDFEQIRLPGFEATLTGQSGPRKLSGRLKSDLMLRPADASLKLDTIALTAQLQAPGLQPLSIGMSGSATASTKNADWALAGEINDNRFSSAGKVNLAANPPSVQLQARFAALDLNALLPPEQAGSATVARAAPMAATPIDLSALRRVNGRIDLQAGSFAYRQYRVTDAQFAATLDGGVLRVGTLKGRTWGGSLDASGMVDAASRRIAVKGSASGVNVNAVQRDLTGRDTVEGSGRLSLDVETAGRNTAELKSQLRGSAAVQLRDGAVKGVNLARSFRQAEAALALKQATSVPSSQTEKTDFSELSASFQIADGIARSADLDAKSPFLRVGGAGAIDIGRSSIDYTLRATVVGAPTGQDGGDLAALKGIVVPVRLTGPLDAVQWKIDWSGVAAAAVQNEIQKQLERQLGGQRPGQAASGARLEDVLKEKLFKGLFK